MKRVLTAVIAIPIVVLVTIYAPDWIFAFVIGLVAAVQYAELAVRENGFLRQRSWFQVPSLAALGGF